MLASIVCEPASSDEGTRLLASIVLKNTLRNHIVDIKQMNPTSGAHNELNCVKEMLLNVLLANSLSKRL
jgi:hypothetical protein